MRFFTSAVSAILALQAGVAYACIKTVTGTILVIARNQAEVDDTAAGFLAYGIQTQGVIVPQTGAALPALNSTVDRGNFGGIVTAGELSYDQGGGNYGSSLTVDQWNAIYQYQIDFGVRLVRIAAYPVPEFGAEPVFSNDDDQLIAFSDVSEFPTANLKTNAGLTTKGNWKTGARITDTATTTAFAKFTGSTTYGETVAGVINKVATGRQQMVWFTTFAPVWSTASAYVQHAAVHWVTRGLFAGRRKTYLGTQVDDVHLSTEIYYPQGQPEFRLRPADLANIKTWQEGLQSRLPAGSNFFIELAHNGNGAFISAVEKTGSSSVCSPNEAVDYDEIVDVAYEWVKPLGTGKDMWPTSFTTTYPWNAQCPKLDELLQWFQTPANRDAFAHLSHTFTHEEMNNATYNDANREMIYNIKWLKDVGFWDAQHFSAGGLVPPAITGLHNGDVIRAWMDNGIKYVVGDNTRPNIRNAESLYWPLITSVAKNGYDGLVIVPRWATTIYYNCDFPICTTQEWIDTSGGSGDFTNLLADAKAVNTRNLLHLYNDPYMFHQANLRQTDADIHTIGDQTGRFSLLQIWIELITQEMTRLTNWPIQTLKHDDIAALFLDRAIVDKCETNVEYIFDHDNKKITGVNLIANGNTCGADVPLTVPGAITTSTGGVVQDTVGSEPTIAWAKLAGSPIAFSLNTPINV